jgi:hypothetical protein
MSSRTVRALTQSRPSQTSSAKVSPAYSSCATCTCRNLPTAKNAAAFHLYGQPALGGPAARKLTWFPEDRPRVNSGTGDPWPPTAMNDRQLVATASSIELTAAGAPSPG